MEPLGDIKNIHIFGTYIITLAYRLFFFLIANKYINKKIKNIFGT